MYYSTQYEIQSKMMMTTNLMRDRYYDIRYQNYKTHICAVAKDKHSHRMMFISRHNGLLDITIHIYIRVTLKKMIFDFGILKRENKN